LWAIIFRLFIPGERDAARSGAGKKANSKNDDSSRRKGDHFGEGRKKSLPSERRNYESLKGETDESVGGKREGTRRRLDRRTVEH